MLTRHGIGNCTTARGTNFYRSVTLAAVVVLKLVVTATAQEYQTLPVDDKARGLRGVAQTCVKSAGDYAANKDKFNEYFTSYHFPSMTRTEPDKLGDIGKLREDLFKTFLWKSSDAVLQHDLT